MLLASGAAVPISQLKPGDKVVATNTKTGKTHAESISVVYLNHDKDLYDLKIRSGHRTAVIRTTSNHPFYDLTRHRWVKAGALRYGDKLRAPGGGAAAVVVRGWAPRQHVGWMWDLSVPGGNDHDFYIDTTIATILVHNCPAPRYSDDQDALLRLAQLASKSPGGISEDEASDLNDWADEYGIKNHGPMTHTGNGYWDQILHIKIANIHIQVIP